MHGMTADPEIYPEFGITPFTGVPEVTEAE